MLRGGGSAVVGRGTRTSIFRCWRPWSLLAEGPAARPVRFGNVRGYAVGATSSSDVFSNRVRALRPLTRAELRAARTNEVAANPDTLCAEVTDIMASKFSFQDLCHLCRVVAASGRRPEERWFVLAKTRSEELVASGVSADTSCDEGSVADAAASLALAACEAGYASTFGAQLIDAICSNGLVSSGSGGAEAEGDAASGRSNVGLGGGGAASMLLAAAAAGRTDAGLFNSLLACCSAHECDLTVAHLGDVRLAMALAGPAVATALDGRAAAFVRTLCGEVFLDDQRGLTPESSAGNYAEACTRFEKEVSEALTASEVLHCLGSYVAGVFVPLASHARRCAVFAEDASSYSVFANAPTERTALQRWKYRAVVSAGWQVIVVRSQEWRELSDSQERADHMRKLLLEPPTVEEL